MTSSPGPLKRIMMHRIYDNLFVRNVAKKGSFMQHSKERTGKAIATLFLRWAVRAQDKTGQPEDEIEISYSFTFAFLCLRNPKYKWPIMTKVRDGIFLGLTVSKAMGWIHPWCQPLVGIWRKALESLSTHIAYELPLKFLLFANGSAFLSSRSHRRLFTFCTCDSYRFLSVNCATILLWDECFVCCRPRNEKGSALP